jgi:hypothetical protein
MKMVILILSLCQTSNPDVCWEKRIPFTEPGLTVMTCVMGAPRMIADPKHGRVPSGATLKKWHCEDGDKSIAKI